MNNWYYILFWAALVIQTNIYNMFADGRNDKFKNNKKII